MEHNIPPRRRTPFDAFFGYLEARLPSDRLIVYVLLFIFVSASLYTLNALNKSHIISVPTGGGTLVEGIIGTPRFVNPVLAITRADHDLVALTYSGLMKLNTEGTLENHLAESITTSEDGLVYNIVLRSDRVFHDGTPVTAEDVAYTIGLIQDPELKSPLRGNWSGVEVEVIGDHEINFVLEDAYTPFIENLTVGILPKHIWGSLTTEELPFSHHNTEPVGSGPYKIETIELSESGLINEYILTAAADTGVSPNIANVHLKFYQDEEGLLSALTEQEIMSTASLSTANLQGLDTANIQQVNQALPRIFSAFFNQNKSPVLRDEGVRKALEVLIDRETLINEVLHGFGTPTSSPVPPDFLSVESTDVSDTTPLTTEEKKAAAREILFDADWVETEGGTWEKEIDEANIPLEITIRTANAEVFERTANYLEEVWSAAGIAVSVELFEQSDLVQAVIRPRDYQVLLFGADVGRALDFYPFWHSSQREDPGLNVALYTNITTDKLLEDMRTTQDIDTRNSYIRDFEKEIVAETPALFLFSPSFIYTLTPNISITPMKQIARPSERFSNIMDWYMNESEVWPIFAK